MDQDSRNDAAGRRSTRSSDYKGVSKPVMIAGRIKALLSGYRRDDYADPEGFIAQVGALMERHRESVIMAATDPTNARSIQRKHQFPPNIKEVADALDAEAAEQARLVKAAQQPKPILNRAYVPPPNFPGCRANVFVHAAAPQFGAIKSWSESPEADARDWKHDDAGRAGLWVGLLIWDGVCGGRITGARQVGSLISDAEMRAHYGQQEAKQAASKVPA